MAGVGGQALGRLVQELEAQGEPTVLERGAGLLHQLVDEAPAALFLLGLRARAHEGLLGPRMLRHLRDDRLELRDGARKLPGLERLGASLERRRQRRGPRDLCLYRFDPRREVGFKPLHRGQPPALVERRRRLIVRGCSDALRQGCLQRAKVITLTADSAADPLRLRGDRLLHLLELVPHLVEVGEPFLGVLPHRALDDRGQLRRYGRRDLAERRRILRPELLEKLQGVLAGERRPQAQKLVEDRADREDVGPVVGPTLDLFRGDVPERPHDQPRPREAAVGRGDLRDPEIEDLHPPRA